MKLNLKTIGSDPEFFIRKKDNKTFIPSALITNGTKERPEETNTKGFYIHKDNLTVEGNIPPSVNRKEFIESMRFVKNIINTLAEIRGCEIVCDDIARYENRFLDLVDAREFGCSGFYDAWNYYSDGKIETPSLYEDFRVAGFHLHLGYETEWSEEEINSGKNKSLTKEDIDRAIGRAFDMFLTLDSDDIKYTKERRDNYGMYGSIRHKPYGLECRALGGYFTQDKYLGWVYDRVQSMFEWLNTDNNIEDILKIKVIKHWDAKERYSRIKEKLNIGELVKCTTL